MDETKGSGPSESGQIHDNKETDAELGENLQRRSHETESRSLQHKNRSTAPDRGGSESKRIYDEGTQMRHQVAQSSAYSVRPSEINCWHYLKNGLCHYGTSCRFNHPIHLRPYCKFFLGGACKNGSACRFYHPMNRDGAEPALLNVPGLPMHQARTPDWRASESSGRLDERRLETGSSSMPVMRAPDSRDRDPRKRFEDINQRRDETVAGFKRARLEQGQENVEEQRQQREIIEKQIREADESFEERRWRERHVQDRQDIEEQRLRDIDTQRSEARLKIKQMKPTVEFNELIYGTLMYESQYQDYMEKERLREMQEKRARDLQLREEERLRDIDRQRTEARMRLDQMQQTVNFDDPHEWEESLRALGFERREGDGF